MPSAECRVPSKAEWKEYKVVKQDLRSRTKQFGLRVLALVESLPRGVSAGIVANQLGRSGTSVGANYRAACKGRSRAEFISKIGIVEEEADESAYWLELVIDLSMLKPAKVRPLLAEANELTAIMAASRITAARNRFKSPAAPPTTGAPPRELRL